MKILLIILKFEFQIKLLHKEIRQMVLFLFTNEQTIKTFAN